VITSFTSYAFPTTGTPTARTLPDRLAEIKNVKDFGATGDGVTDDWAAITATINWTTGNASNRGTIFFPPGTYYVSQPIIVGGGNFILSGVAGASTIIGNFAEYVLKRDNPNTNTDPGSVIENLTVVNQHATGGGIRMGACVCGAIRDCVVTANQAISNAINDTVAPETCLDFSIENCTVSPGANVSGSNGIMSIADGPIYNCRVIGFETGMRFWAGEGCMNVLGCYFEQNIVGIAFGPPTVVSGGTGGVTVSGCRFKDNGTAIKFDSTGRGGGNFLGNYIEASEAVTVGGGRPQYGIYVGENSTDGSLFAGITVTGQYDQYGIYVASHAGSPAPTSNVFMGVKSINTSTHGGLAWFVPSTGYTAKFIECNCPAPVYTIANLPVSIGAFRSLAWSGGTATAELLLDVSALIGQPQPITVKGVTPSGYNGSFIATMTGVSTLTYTVANPGGSGSGGTIVVNRTQGGIPVAFEGDCYNVSDSNVSSWGGNPVGGGSTHAQVRFNGSDWTVVGK
jgi:Pectate lyase superfamily protein